MSKTQLKSSIKKFFNTYADAFNSYGEHVADIYCHRSHVYKKNK
ncbi:MAG TPA: hypothetical protein QF753_13605 [Victivallales bacterium]|nr:hypothetical protein [Victivallales bacterium]